MIDKQEAGCIRMRRQMCKAGETAFAVVKNSYTFQFEVVQTTVFCVEGDTIVLHHPSDPFTTDVYRFPAKEWLNMIFRTPEEAEIAKEKTENKGI